MRLRVCYAEELQSTPPARDNHPAGEAEDYVYASSPDHSTCSTPQSQVATWPDRKGLANLVPWYYRDFPERDNHPARTRRQYEREEQDFEYHKTQFWWQYDGEALGHHLRRDADESYKRYRLRGGQRRQKMHHQGTEDIYREFPLAPDTLLEPPFEYDDPRLLSPAPHRIENGYYRRHVRPLYEHMRRDGTLTEHWQDLRDAWWAAHGKPLIQPTWWFDTDDGLPALKDATTPAEDNQPLHPDYPPELFDPASSLKDPAQAPVAEPNQPYHAEPDYASNRTGVNDGTYANSTSASSPTPDHISQGTQVDKSYTMPAVHHQETQTDTR